MQSSDVFVIIFNCKSVLEFVNCIPALQRASGPLIPRRFCCSRAIITALGCRALTGGLKSSSFLTGLQSRI